MGANTANVFAYLALIIAAPLIWWGYGVLRPQVACFWAFFGAALFMPMLDWDPPMIPAMDKVTIPAVASILVLPRMLKSRFRAAKPLRGIDLIAVATLLGLFGTVFTNGDMLIDTDESSRQALTYYDAISSGLGFILASYIPFLIARSVYRTNADANDFLRCLVIAGLIYAPLLLIEIRLSPQLHRWIYGYFPHSWQQTMREGGFRPVGFLGHGLIAARFVESVIIAAAILWKGRLKQVIPMVPNSAIVAFMVVLLIFSKSLGALVLVGIAVPLIVFTSPKAQMRVAIFFSVVTLLYPALRLTGNFPVDDLLDISSRIDPSRAQSLEFRFVNEDALLERAVERVALGWGGYGRNRVVDERGKDVTITDGEWIIALGIYGVVGFLGRFGLIVLPVFVASRNLKRIHSARDRSLVSGLALLTSVLSVDLVPNSLGVFPHYFVSGLLFGVATGLVLEASRRQAPSAAALQKVPTAGSAPPSAVAGSERMPRSG
jgi:hypothetical protein